MAITVVEKLYWPGSHLRLLQARWCRPAEKLTLKFGPLSLQFATVPSFPKRNDLVEPGALGSGEY